MVCAIYLCVAGVRLTCCCKDWVMFVLHLLILVCETDIAFIVHEGGTICRYVAYFVHTCCCVFMYRMQFAHRMVYFWDSHLLG